MRERIAQRAAELRRQAEETKRNAEMQITALLTAAAELEKLLETPGEPQQERPT